MSGPARVVLMGPRRLSSGIGAVLDESGSGDSVVTVTAGWQEWEADPERLDPELRFRSHDLRLAARAERVWSADPALRAAHRRMQERIRLLRRAYNLRLAGAMKAWSDVAALSGDEHVLAGEREAAKESVRVLDRQHADRIRELRNAFEEAERPGDREAVRRERDEVSAQVRNATAVVIEGGHVPALLNRLRLFGVEWMLDGKLVVGRAGGAMALAERVVLFHDSPPWGPGHAEVGEFGLGFVRNLVALPDASTRLKLDDSERVQRFAQRFTPSACVVLDEGTRVSQSDGGWRAENARHLTASGAVETWGG